MSLVDTANFHQPDIDAVNSWCDEIYKDNFELYFKDTKQLFKRLESKYRPITDEELEQILTLTPLQLFAVSEVLNRFRLNQEVIKLNIKRKHYEAIHSSNLKTLSSKSEEADISVLEDKLLSIAYSTVIVRVENEISFSKELIMSAKKIYQSRQDSYNANPVNPIKHDTGTTLPDYTITKF